MVVKRADAGDGGPGWPDELWYFDRSRFGCRHEWLCACMEYAKRYGYNRLAVNKLMTNRRPLGVELAMELTTECRQRVPRRVNGFVRR
jgi:hypothetical protein